MKRICARWNAFGGISFVFGSRDYKNSLSIFSSQTDPFQSIVINQIMDNQLISSSVCETPEGPLLRFLKGTLPLPPSLK